MSQRDLFYNLRLPFQLGEWSKAFDKHERSHILRCFISLMIEAQNNKRLFDQVRRWANGQASLTLPAPGFHNGVPVPRDYTPLKDEED